MDNQDPEIANLKQLLAEEKFDEAREIIKGYFAKPLSKEESGQAYLDIAEIYLDISNHFARQKKELMETALEAISDLEKKGKKLDDLINLDEVRKKIQGS